MTRRVQRKRGERRKPRTPAGRVLTLGLLVAVFGLSHAAYYLKGVRFDDSTLVYYWQYLDLPLLRHRLVESLFYLHSQPPLFNLFLGGVLKLFPGDPSAAFHAAYLVLGMALYGTSFALMRRLGVSTVVALIAATWFMLSPSFVAYEHFLFYSMPTAALLAVSMLLFHDLLERQTGRAALLFFGCLFLLCALRASYHLIYYLAAMAAAVALCTRRRRAIALVALVPLLLLLSLYVKNLVLFGNFATSSWVGMNLASNTVDRIPREERREMIERGELSLVVASWRFNSLEAYPEEYRRVRGFEGIAALRDSKKSTGANNYNHLGYLAISRQYLKDDLYVIEHYPKVFLKGLACSWFCYFQSSSNFRVLTGNRDKMALVERVYDHVFYGVLPWRVWRPLQSRLVPEGFAKRDPMPRPFPFLMVGLPILLIFGLRVGLMPRRGGLGRNQRMLVLFVCCNIIYAALVGNVFEGGENHRFRFETDALYAVLLGLLIQHSVLPGIRARIGKGAGARKSASRPRRGEEPEA